jgi:hypothetical protein
MEDGRLVLDAEIGGRWKAKFKNTELGVMLRVQLLLGIWIADERMVICRAQARNQRSGTEDIEKIQQRNTVDTVAVLAGWLPRTLRNERQGRDGGGMVSQSSWQEREGRYSERDYSPGRYQKQRITIGGRVRDKNSGWDVTFKRMGAIGVQRRRIRRDKADRESDLKRGC